jgi:hypothetical protein
MKVYVVSRGWQYEGGAAISVHATIESASAAAAREELHRGEWRQVKPSGGRIAEWESGGQYVAVEPMEVQD